MLSKHLPKERLSLNKGKAPKERLSLNKGKTSEKENLPNQSHTTRFSPRDEYAKILGSKNNSLAVNSASQDLPKTVIRSAKKKSKDTPILIENSNKKSLDVLMDNESTQKKRWIHQ